MSTAQPVGFEGGRMPVTELGREQLGIDGDLAVRDGDR